MLGICLGFFLEIWGKLWIFGEHFGNIWEHFGNIVGTFWDFVYTNLGKVGKPRKSQKTRKTDKKIKSPIKVLSSKYLIDY